MAANQDRGIGALGTGKTDHQKTRVRSADHPITAITRSIGGLPSCRSGVLLLAAALIMFRLRKRPYLATFFFLLVSFVALAAKKIFDYAAPPSGPKDCNFVFPF